MAPSFRKLDISTKLLLSALAFVLPLAVLTFFMDLSFRYDINLARAELAGTAYLKHILPLPRELHRHRALLQAVAMGHKDEIFALKNQTAKLDAAFAALPDARAEFLAGIAQAPTAANQSLVERTNPSRLAAAWRDLREGGPQERYAAFLARAIALIQGVSDCALLTVDPALDSASLADAVLLYTPRAMAALQSAGLLTERLTQSDGGLSALDRQTIAAATAQFQAEGLGPLHESATAALALDGAFYGAHAGMRNIFSPALAAYEARAAALIQTLEALRQGRATPGEAGLATRDTVTALFKLQDTGLVELEHLIALRMDSYAAWRGMGFAFSFLAALAAALLMARTWRSVASGIGKVRKYTTQVASGDYDARPERPDSGELAEMSDGIGTMVGELKNTIGHLNSILGGLTVPCLMTDPQERLTFLNRHYLDLYEKDGEPGDYLGQTIGEFFYGDPDRETITGQAMRENKNFRDVELESVTARGNTRFVRYDVAPIHDSGGTLLGAFAVITDLTRLREQQERILFDATHDALTGLPNKTVLLERIRTARTQISLGEERTLAVLLLDVDNFKHVNDSMGHAFGDLLLGEIAGRIGLAMREDALLTRLGGDEFALFLDPVAGEEETLEAARTLHEALGRPFLVDGRELYVTTAIGIALACPKCDAEDLLRDADTAMYRAKARGAGHAVVFDADMHRLVRERLELETDMKRGVERGEFEPFFQPIVDLGTGAMHGFEALARWNHPRRGLVPPGHFIPLAEENGLVVPIGADILAQSLAAVASWREAGPGAPELSISVNLAVPQLMRPNVVDEVAQVLEHCGLPPSAVKLEITESGLMENAEAALSVMGRLKDLGVALSIDDFGTGYSSLSYLNRLPFDYLKVDQSFVFAMLETEHNMEIVRTIVALAHSLGRKVIAEGIETPEHLAALRALGCEYGQGYLFAKPLPGPEALKLLSSRPIW